MLNIIQNPYQESSNLYSQLEAMNIIKISDDISIIKSKTPLSQQELNILAPNGCISQDIVFTNKRNANGGFKVKHYEYQVNPIQQSIIN
jgi:hypothetical protein